VSPQKKNNIPADKLELYEKLVKTNPKVERKGAANPYTSLNGHMFTYLNASGSLALRLPENEREKFLKKYKTALFEAYGAVMKEYVTVPDNLLKDTKTLQQYFQLSYEYVKSLKPKPTTKTKKKNS
jgi:TfoX/Sxy family transcriptional regulator of competence genes